MNSVKAKSSRKRGLKFTAMQLERWHWRDGKSMSDIAREYGVSPEAISYQYKKLGVKTRSKLQELLFEPSPALSYVIGVLFGDGCVYRNPARNGGCEIKLNVTDRVFALSFSKALNLIGVRSNTLAERASNNPKWKATNLTYGNSKSFYEWWEGHDDQFLIGEAAVFPQDFVRGMYESEGSIKWHHGRLEISISNTDLNLLGVVKDEIQIRGIRCGWFNKKRSQPHHKDSAEITITNALDVKRFLAWTMPCIKIQPRGQANTEPSRNGNIVEGVENTKAIQNGRRVGDSQ